MKAEGCENTSVFEEEEAVKEYKRGLLSHTGSKQGIVHPTLQHSHCETLTETPTLLWKKPQEEAQLHAAGPEHLTLCPLGAGSPSRFGQGERHLRTTGSGLGYSREWEVPSHTRGFERVGAVGGWCGQNPGVVDTVCSFPWLQWEIRLDSLSVWIDIS